MSTVKDQKIISLEPSEFVRKCTYSAGCGARAAWQLSWTQKGTSPARGSFSHQTRLACDEHAEMYAKRANLAWPQ